MSTSEKWLVAIIIFLFVSAVQALRRRRVDPTQLWPPSIFGAVLGIVLLAIGYQIVGYFLFGCGFALFLISIAGPVWHGIQRFQNGGEEEASRNPRR